jgi:hypothetical protein
VKDFCSRWPDEVGGVYYGDCCAAHDEAYRQPGDRHDRRRADAQLKACLLGKGVPKWWVWITWAGTRLFGWTLWHYNRGFFNWKN